MRIAIVTLLLAGTVLAGPSSTRAERHYRAALALVEIAERASKPEARRQLMVRAAPVARQARAWLRRAKREGDDVTRLDRELTALQSRIARGKGSLVVSTGRSALPSVPRTGTVVIVAREPEAAVAGTPSNAQRVARRREDEAWRARRALARVGTRAMDQQRDGLVRRTAARAEQLRSPKNIARIERRKELNRWRMARVAQRVSR